MRLLTALALIALGFVSYRLIEVENQRYALAIGMCRGPAVADMDCLSSVETRTSPLWHLYYGLIGQ